MWPPGRWRRGPASSGLVNFELFGQFENVVTDRSAFFDHAVRCLGRVIGIPV
jgi:hypothetical protein